MDASLEQHRERFAADPDAAAAFEVLEEHAFMQQSWEDLMSLYRARLGAPSLADEPAARAQLQLRIAQTLEERCSDTDGAVLAYSEAARLDPRLRAALGALRRIHAARGAWEMVLQIAELECEACEAPAERAQVLAEMGDVWHRELGDPQQAEQYYARARSESGSTEDDDLESDPNDSGPLVQAAWLAAARGDSAAALAALREALERNPADTEAIDMMVTVLDGAERHADMADLLERRASLASDPETRAAVLTRLGTVREEHLGDISAARSAFERALAAAPTSAAARGALTRAYRQSESWSSLRMLLESIAGDGSDAQRVHALCDLAELLRAQFADRDAAAKAWERALEIAPADDRARVGLAQLLSAPEESSASTADARGDDSTDAEARGENRSVRVAEVLERKLFTFEEHGDGLGPDAIALRLRIAELRLEPLDDLPAAIEILEPAIEDDVAILAVAGRLTELYERNGQTDRVIDVARRAAARSDDPEDRAGWHRLAAENAQRSGDTSVAIESYTRLLESHPQDRNAEANLMELHRSGGDAEPLVGLLRARLPRTLGEQELDLHLELAVLLDGPIDDGESVLAHLRRALELDPRREDVLQHALRVADRVGGSLRKLDLVDHLYRTEPDNMAAARLMAVRGDLLADDLGWTSEAISSWEDSLSFDPQQAGVRARLESARA